jgi:hypothetical protein
MPGKMFVSCGQKIEEEIRTAGAIEDWLTDEGFRPYVAIQAQTILDLNGEIIRELKQSDFYLFINFRRESLGDESFRGSLLTNQELAIAYSLGFETPRRRREGHHPDRIHFHRPRRLEMAKGGLGRTSDDGHVFSYDFFSVFGD